MFPNEILTYEGEPIVRSKLQVRTTLSAFSNVTTTTEKDSLGRVIKVTTPLHETKFRYDPYDRQYRSSRGEGGITQIRLLGRDARGFLLSERHPETGATGNGTITYARDAFGQVRRQDYGARDLSYLYDAGARSPRSRRPTRMAWSARPTQRERCHPLCEVRPTIRTYTGSRRSAMPDSEKLQRVEELKNRVLVLVMEAVRIIRPWVDGEDSPEGERGEAVWRQLKAAILAVGPEDILALQLSTTPSDVPDEVLDAMDLVLADQGLPAVARLKQAAQMFLVQRRRCH